MEKMRLSERFQVRISPELRDALAAAARRLKVRPADVARMALAEALAKFDQPAIEGHQELEA